MGKNNIFLHWSGLRFVQEIKIIFKYRDCLKVLRIVICKYEDLTREFDQKYSFRAKSHFESLLVWLVWYKEISLWGSR